MLQRLRAGGIAGRGPELVVLSALAEGADRLVAQAVLGGPFHGHLEAILPLEVADYSQDFSTPQSVADFQQLLARADTIHFPPAAERSTDLESHAVGIRLRALRRASKSQRGLSLGGDSKWLMRRTCCWPSGTARGRPRRGRHRRNRGVRPAARPAARLDSCPAAAPGDVGTSDE